MLCYMTTLYIANNIQNPIQLITLITIKNCHFEILYYFRTINILQGKRTKQMIIKLAAQI